jgi:glycosyltransferase involved in cell wall biosynthesis
MEKMIKKAGSSLPFFARIDRDYLDLTSKGSESFTVSFPAHVKSSDLFLVIDIYSAVNHVHPEGHVGWWRFNLSGEKDTKVKINKSKGRLNASFQKEKQTGEKWINPDFIHKDDDTFSIHIVLRNIDNEAIEFEDRIYLFTKKTAIENSLRIRDGIENNLEEVRGMATRWYCWPDGATVHLFATDIKSEDAVGNFTFDIFKFLRLNDIPCSMYAQNFDPLLRGIIKPAQELFFNLKKQDVIFLHFSIFDPYLDAIAALPFRKVVYYHNITPPRMFQIYDAELAEYCSKAYGQFEMLKSFDAFMSNSVISVNELKKLSEEHNILEDEEEEYLEKDYPEEEEADEKGEEKKEKKGKDDKKRSSRPLSRIYVCPPLINLRKWDIIEEIPFNDLPEADTLLLYVGRVAPHKKIEDLIFLYNEYHKLDPDSRLLIIGGAAFKGYKNYINYLLEKQDPRIKDRIHLFNNVSPSQLKNIYGISSLFVTMSEHEGFCIPLVEAMYFRKPVFAYAQDAVVETMGKSGRLFYEKDFQSIATEIDKVVKDPMVIDKIIEAQDERFEDLALKANGETLWKALEAALRKKDEGTL